MIEEHTHNQVYEKVDAMFKLRIKGQLKKSGVLFEQFFKSLNLVTGEIVYHLVINKMMISFNDSEELVVKLAKAVRVVLKETEREISAGRQKSGFMSEEDWFYINDALYSKEYKLSKLLNRLVAIHNKINKLS